MNEMICVTEKDGVQSVSARDLYEKLEINERFSRWFGRMAEYGFSEKIDYTPYQTVHPQNQQEITDYSITLEMAKQMCMLQRTEKGKQYRDYFIRLEKAWNTPEATIYRALQLAHETFDDNKLTIDRQQKQISFLQLKLESIKSILYDIPSVSKNSAPVFLSNKLIDSDDMLRCIMNFCVSIQGENNGDSLSIYHWLCAGISESIEEAGIRLRGNELFIVRDSEFIKEKVFNSKNDGYAKPLSKSKAVLDSSMTYRVGGMPLSCIVLDWDVVRSIMDIPVQNA